MSARVVSVVAALALALTMTVVGLASGTADAAPADGCYTWSRNLSEGANGDDVRQLQIRLSGHVSQGEVLGLDGDFGPATKAAVTRFQQAYGLSQTGVADSATYGKIYALQDDDCTPVNFTFAELNRCNSDWSGGAVSASAAKASALVSMWKLQAMRHALGDQPITVTSGFRSRSCNDAVGGAPDSRHLYGDAVDLGAGPHSLCTLAKQARNHGFNGILGPGFQGHDDHVHADGRSSRFWSAPDCGIATAVPGGGAELAIPRMHAKGD
ncbi:zinc D-Ala-D-Ala carboxypeptidase [Herbihabitans rhizosphaerae]|uniref:Zinc D-Ala-D-Ala carboxypeptidase n=1 Tax=Herbihabitans rhizosphaerae TaxID=1872711 RepID=A0A4Q7KLR1_9PSEU|nr:D-Ala-D-Ala carboxypeptidase family metallohydrolase [Herbihabitans rhizosphaerae]RZS37194.1 zinc D-Ala-D-Ala carboxypeptidase [Herbihabitans rhizosphaerae]